MLALVHDLAEADVGGTVALGDENAGDEAAPTKGGGER